MPFVIDDIILNSVVSTIVSSAVSKGLSVIKGGGPVDDPKKNLEKFLDILSKDFAFKVEDIIKMHFTQMRMEDLHAYIVAAGDHMRLYTESGDISHLHDARRLIVEKIHNFWLKTLFPKLGNWEPNDKNAEAVISAGLDLLTLIVALEMFVFSLLVYHDAKHLPIAQSHCENYRKTGEKLVNRFCIAVEKSKDRDIAEITKYMDPDIIFAPPRGGAVLRAKPSAKQRQDAEQRFTHAKNVAKNKSWRRQDERVLFFWMPFADRLADFKNKIPLVAEQGQKAKSVRVASVRESDILSDQSLAFMTAATTSSFFYAAQQRVRPNAWRPQPAYQQRSQLLSTNATQSAAAFWQRQATSRKAVARWAPLIRTGLNLMRTVFR